MDFKNILVTGGAGFVGSNLALKLKRKYPRTNIFALDNLKRRGSELNIARLKAEGIYFIHGDIRNQEDLDDIGQDIDLVLECSAEPSVLAGIDSSPAYLINTNLTGTINCLELARKKEAAFFFISTSRVYPFEAINALDIREADTRFELVDSQSMPGASGLGISEEFPLAGARSIYGATKLCSELMLQEYVLAYGVRGVVNRCGVITGPWQMGKTDQGFFVLWVARHIYGGPLSYIGFGGQGKQVRDFLHIDDLFDALDIQLNDLDRFNGMVLNVGGGIEKSVSLKELTDICENVTGKRIEIKPVNDTRPADLKTFITDYSRFNRLTGWSPRKDADGTVRDIAEWINNNKESLRPILS